MPNGKRGRTNDSLGKADGPAREGMPEPEQETAGMIREGVERVGQRMREGYETVGDAVGHGYHNAEDLVARYPTPSVLFSFGLGLGLGVLLTVALTQRKEPWWQDWRVLDSLSQLRDRFGHTG